MRATTELADQSVPDLADRLAYWTRTTEQSDPVIPGLRLFRLDAPTERTSYTMTASFCLIAQGRKRVFLGEEHFDYDANRFLVASIDLPVIAQVLDATPERPYLGLSLDLDVREISHLMLSLDAPPPPQTPQDTRGMAVSEVSAPLLDAVGRLIDLHGSPRDIPVLAPLIKREILYRLLTGDQGPRLRRIASAESHGYRVNRAIDWLKSNYRAAVRVEDMASLAGLSPSAFHSHFRAMTAMSPLQYQKRLRLNEARRLMLTDRLDAASAAFEVGYESPSQFSREYSRMFGAPPARDIRALLTPDTAARTAAS